MLWDIDRTLIDMQAVGLRLYSQAFTQVTGRTMERHPVIDGKTDPVIFHQTARLHGIDTTVADFRGFVGALADRHRRQAEQIRRQGRALPGAAAALAAVARLPGALQTVVTGNVRPVAQIKLTVFGLHTHIDWALGGFGDDHYTRDALVADALRHVRERAQPPDAAVLVGDTPADIAAGHAHGVPVVAVATGSSGPRELRAAGADAVLSDLADTRLVLQRIRSLAASSGRLR
ncbi:HAD family hydrolase [Nonomuraea candida]|uniref:HAD family hydrolase n=1 Tax=Nonomuraea candida TaxID=359159 RepID=UPI001B8096A5|nr:haloacid dehalogenase-like hydrolase [Nonomuraea candida]